MNSRERRNLREVWRLAFLWLTIFQFGAARPATEPVSPGCAGIDGQTYHPLTVTPARAAVLVFILQDCPICNGYLPMIQRLADEGTKRGAVLFLVQVDPGIADGEARKHARDYGYTIPTLLDRKHDLVRRLQVKSAPTAVVLAADGSTAYEGRIDDRYAALGKPREVATTHELADALAAVLDGKSVVNPRTVAVGCAVPDLPK